MKNVSVVLGTLICLSMITITAKVVRISYIFLVSTDFPKERSVYLAGFFGFLVLSIMLSVIALLIVNLKDKNNDQEK